MGTPFKGSTFWILPGVWVKVGLRVALGSQVCFFGPFRVEVARVGVGVSENRGCLILGSL